MRASPSPTCRRTPSSTCACAACASWKRWKSAGSTRNSTEEGKELQALLGDQALRWERIAQELEETRKKFGAVPLGERRTTFAEAPSEAAVAPEAFIEREAITVVLSDKGWIRALGAAVADPDELKFKDGDRLRLLLACETTDRLPVCDQRPRLHAQGRRPAAWPRRRPARPGVDGNDQRGRRGGAVPAPRRGTISGRLQRRPRLPGRAEEFLAEKRTGKQVLNLRPGEEARSAPAEGDHVAAIGTAHRCWCSRWSRFRNSRAGRG